MNNLFAQYIQEITHITFDQYTNGNGDSSKSNKMDKATSDVLTKVDMIMEKRYMDKLDDIENG